MNQLAEMPAYQRPIDWDNYEREFDATNPAYAAQEAALAEVFAGVPQPSTILEVGPGLGRITRMLAERFAPAHFALFDLSEVAIEKASAAVPSKFAYGIGRIQDRQDWAKLFPFGSDTGDFDLVVAVEVLLHVPPEDIGAAIDNLLAATRGTLVTCDWTKPLDVPIRVQNYLHDYTLLFYRAGAKVIDQQRVGAQTIYVVQP